MKTVSVIGLGYIGLPTSIILAISNFKVSGFDVDINKVEKINAGLPTISEKGIKEKLNLALKKSNLKAYASLKVADIYIISVPTPFTGNKQADLSFVFDAAKQIANKLKKGDLVILESTVPVGTTSKLTSFLEKESGLVATQDFFLAYCPERVLPGKIFKELIENDRVVGGICNNSSVLAEHFYSKFISGKIHNTSDKVAEIVKLAENSYRDLNIAFANELASMANTVKINPFEVIDIANKHPRVNILRPGCGVGGHCIAVDPWFLIQSFPECSSTLKMARKVNDSKPDKVIKKVLNKVAEFNKNNNKKANVLVLGLTFKPDVDDLRGSPALYIAQKLNNKNKLLDISVVEPNIEDIKLVEFKFFKNLNKAVSWSDLILILVSHSHFLALKKINLANKNIIDESGLLDNIKKNFNKVNLNLIDKKYSKVRFDES